MSPYFFVNHFNSIYGIIFNKSEYSMIDKSQLLFAPGYDRLFPGLTTSYGEDHATATSIFSSTDIVTYVTLPGQHAYKLGTLAMMSISSHRDKFPVTSLGRHKVKGFTAGPRVIAGTLVFNSYDRTVWHRMLVADKDIKIEKRASPMERRSRGLELLKADELPPFDLSLTFVNEFGHVSYTALLGVTILDQGQTFSVDDIKVMETYSYMAIDIVPFQPFQVLDLGQYDGDPPNKLQDTTVGIILDDGDGGGGGGGGGGDTGGPFTQRVFIYGHAPLGGLDKNDTILPGLTITCVNTGQTQTSTCDGVYFNHSLPGEYIYSVTGGCVTDCDGGTSFWGPASASSSDSIVYVTSNTLNYDGGCS